MWELVLVRRMNSGEWSSSSGQMPTLPEGVRPCEGIPRESWSTRVVILTNKAGEDVTRAICRSVDASIVVDKNGRPIGDDHGPRCSTDCINIERGGSTIGMDVVDALMANRKSVFEWGEPVQL